MPHDRLNRELKPGDRVILEGVVTEVYPGQETCNAIVRPAHAKEGDWPVTLNAHWLEKREGTAPAPESAREGGMGDVAS
ncbi:MAG TPA: hypothetical protein VGT06_03600 [Candidatus Methylomirabilis sp.]|jgi:hypothetical protein|nr:hypothetical protein [Candidatus Methylomirabilis sp.]